uniref:Uncharacterized protein n=1 Tax=Opuntia streptacantha TaxID=393608 RepID=A0A7C9ERG6_OPUST
MKERYLIQHPQNPRYDYAIRTSMQLVTQHIDLFSSDYSFCNSLGQLLPTWESVSMNTQICHLLFSFFLFLFFCCLRKIVQCIFLDIEIVRYSSTFQMSFFFS